MAELEDIRIKYVVDDNDIKRSQQTLKSLTAEERALVEQMKQVNAAATKTGDTITKAAKEGTVATKGLRDEMGRVGKSAGEAGEKIKSGLGGAREQLAGVGQVANRLGSLISGAFAVDQLLQFGKRVLDITAQFQKLQAVLNNALGSESAGQIAFAQIQDFAARTNFSVLELTDSYVKLANRGIKPTTENLRSIADVANALGKPLSDVNEAILDVSNTERWTELGVKVTKSGDQIKATFRGVTVSAKATEQGALDLITQLGQIEGVAGSTAAIAETLGGKISNMGDAFDSLFNTLGSKGDGIFGELIGYITGTAQAIERLIKSEEQLARERGLKQAAMDGEAFRNEINGAVAAYERYGLSAEEAKKRTAEVYSEQARRNMQDLQKDLEDLDSQINESINATGLTDQLKDFANLAGAVTSGGLTKALGLEMETQNDITKQLQLQKVEIENKIKLYEQQLGIAGELVKKEGNGVEKQLGLIQELQARIKALRDEQEKSRDVSRIQAINGEVRKTQDELDKLLGKTKKVSDEAARAAEAFAKLAAGIKADVSQQDVNLLESLFGEDDARVIEARAALTRQKLETEFSALKKELEEVGKKAGKSDAEIKVQIDLADEAFRDKLELLDKDTRDKVNEANRQYEQMLRDFVINAQNAALTAQTQGEQQALDRELIALSNLLRSKEISIEEYNRRRLALESNTSAEILELEIATLEKQVNIAGLSIEERNRMETDLLDKKRQLADQEVEIAREKQQRIRELEEEGFGVLVDGANALFEIRSQKRDAELDNLRVQQQAELKLVGDNAQAKEFIQNEFALKERAVKLRQAQADKAQALFNIGINTLASAAKTAAQLGFPAAIPFVAGALAQGAIQAAVVAAKPLPKFRDGVLDLKGPGTERSDSIHAMLSRGESVMTAEETRQFFPTLKAIRSRTIDPELLNSVVRMDYQALAPALPQNRPAATGQAGSDYSRLVKEQQQTNKILRTLPVSRISMDEKGFKKFIQRGDSITEVLNSQFPI